MSAQLAADVETLRAVVGTMRDQPCGDADCVVCPRQIAERREAEAALERLRVATSHAATGSSLTPGEHKARHEALHRYLDELVADFLRHTSYLPSSASVLDLMKWSHEQTQNPTEAA